MKILIAYATKTGTTEICAKHLARELPQHDIELCNVAVSEPDISSFDLIIIGGSIRLGKLDKQIKAFIEKNKDKLLESRTAYFICNGFNEETDRYFKKCFPHDLIEKSLLYESFGGELKLDKQKGLDKLIVKMILKSNEENDNFIMPGILTESINRFADSIKDL